MCQGEMKKMVEAIQKMPMPETQESEETTNDERPPSGDVGDFFLGID